MGSCASCASSKIDETTLKCLELGCVCVGVTGNTGHVDGAGGVYPSNIWVVWVFSGWFLPYHFYVR